MASDAEVLRPGNELSLQPRGETPLDHGVPVCESAELVGNKDAMPRPIDIPRHAPRPGRD
jgi:hypothetical protein